MKNTTEQQDPMKTQNNTLAVLIVPAVAVALLVGCGKPQPPAVALEEAAVKGDVAAIRQHVTAGSNLEVHSPMKTRES
jgi:hypothetical protein